MTISYIILSILGIIMITVLIVYLKYFIHLRPQEPGFEYVYVKEDGTVCELDEEDVEYLKTEFSPANGARPYIKSRYSQRAPDKKISGFILRNRVPKKIKIKPNQNVEDERTISWIFMATSIASEKEPTDFKGISMIADGINHAVPTHKELQSSISWLCAKGLVVKNKKKYALTTSGKREYEKAIDATNTLLKIWDNLEERIKKYA